MGKSNKSQSNKTKSVVKKNVNVKSGNSGEGGLTEKEEGILQALGKLNAAGITQPKRDMVLALSGNGKTIEGFKKNMGNIRKKGFLEYPDGTTVALTEKGVEYVGQPEAGSLTNEIYHNEVIKTLLSNKAGTIFDAISNGKVHDKKDIAAKLGYDMTKLSGYDKDLSKMTTLGFLEKTKTTIQLTEKCEHSCTSSASSRVQTAPRYRQSNTVLLPSLRQASLWVAVHEDSWIDPNELEQLSFEAYTTQLTKKLHEDCWLDAHKLEQLSL